MPKRSRIIKEDGSKGLFYFNILTDLKGSEEKYNMLCG